MDTQSRCRDTHSSRRIQACLPMQAGLVEMLRSTAAQDIMSQ